MRSQTNERTQESARINLGQEGKLFLFCFTGKGDHPGAPTLEELIDRGSSYLRGQQWETTQCAELVIIGIADGGKRYILNHPSKWALEKLQDEYGKRQKPKQERINNRRIREVIIRNMLDDGPSSVILRGHTTTASTVHGYVRIKPTELKVNTQELNEMMSQLMELHMFRVNSAANLQWLRAAYKR